MNLEIEMPHCVCCKDLIGITSGVHISKECNQPFPEGEVCMSCAKKHGWYHDVYPDEPKCKAALHEEKPDLVNHPPHYKGNKFECIDIIEDFKLNFNLGNSIKYILRSDKKGANVTDLRKAMWYLSREIKNLSGEP